MKPEDSLPCSWEAATGPYPEQHTSSPHLPHFSSFQVPYQTFELHTLPVSSILLDHPNIICWNIQVMMRLQPLTTSSLLDPNIVLSTLFSNTHDLCSSLSVRHQVSHLYKKNSKIMVLYVLIFKFLKIIQKKNYVQNGSKHSLNLIYS